MIQIKWIFIIIGLGILPSLYGQEKVKVITTITTYADVVRQIGGDKVEVKAIVEGDQDAHYVTPKPSFAVWLSRADMFVETGLDLELWAPALIDKSGNPRIRSGQPGYVAAADGVEMLEVPTSPDRSQGDVHIYGNPHITTSPINMKVIAENVAIGLSKISPENATFFKERLNQFKQQIDERLFGTELVRILGGETLSQLVLSGQLIPFLESESFQGKKMIDYLGGWLKEMYPYRGKKLIAYHRNWAYFEQVFGLQFIGYVEPKPGIPPSPKHVEKLIQTVKQNNAKVILTANYFDERKAREIAERINGVAVIVPLSTEGITGVNTYFELMDYWIKNLIAAFEETAFSFFPSPLILVVCYS
jgi:zinc/manganese transport system substrate-binding protein